jgi:hypothetical protein
MGHPQTFQLASQNVSEIDEKNQIRDCGFEMAKHTTKKLYFSANSQQTELKYARRKNENVMVRC